MIAYIVRRLLIAIPAVWLVLSLVFVGFRLVPGDAVQVMASQAAQGTGTSSTARDLVRLRHQLGLDRPLVVQYGDFLTHAVRLDFGRSFASNLSVWDEIRERIPYTAELALSAWLLSLVLGLVTGVLAALWNRRTLATGIVGLAVLGMSLPNYWLGTMLALVFGVHLHWLPLAGAGGAANLVLPAVTLAALMTARLTRQTRAALVEILRTDYVRTARAKGLQYRVILLRHVLRNALIPLVTLLGLDLAALLSGVVIVENVFAWPGLGTLVLAAVQARDYPVIEGTTFVCAVILILANLLVDLAYRWLDPRMAHA